MGNIYNELKIKQRLQQREPETINILAPTPEPPKEFDTLEVFKSAFARENTIGSTIASIGANNFNEDEEDPDYDLINKIDGTKYAPYVDSFIGNVYNDSQFNKIASKIDREIEDREIIESSGTLGVVASITAGILDPINLIPIGGVAYKTLKAGKTLKGLTRGAEIGFASEIATESVLQSQQETRTIEESSLNIAGGTILGGVIGGLAGKFSKADFDDVSNRMVGDMQREKPLLDIDENGELKPQGGSVGSAFVEPEKIDPNLAGGKKTQALIKATSKLNPMLRVLTSSSQEAKNILPSLVRTNMYFKKNFNDIATDQSTEIAIKSYDAGLGFSINGGKSNYKQLHKRLKQQGEKPVSIENFYDQVSLAMIRGDKSDIPEVEKTAKLYRSQIFDPLLNRGVEVGLFPEELKTVPSKTALSYLTRKYDINKIVAREEEFKNILRTGARERLIPDVVKELKKTEINLEKLKTERVDVKNKIEKGGLSGKEYDKLIDRRIELDALVGDTQAIDLYIEDIVNNLYDNIRGVETKGVNMPYDLKITTRGPAKEKTLLFVKDEEIREFLDTDITNIAKSYTRTIGTDVEIKAKFGSLDLKDQLDNITEEYNQLRKGKTEKERMKLDKEEKEVKRIISSLKDVLRGHYGRPNNPDSFFVKTAQASRTINYMSKLGGVTISSIPDIGRHIMVHGYGRVMNKGIRNLITNLKAVKLSTKDAKFAGQLWEQVTHQRSSLMADLQNPYTNESRFQTMLSWMADKFSKFNGLSYWNDFQKGFSSMLTQSRIIENVNKYDKLKAKEKAYMNFLGIDRSTANKLKKQLDLHSTKEGNFPIANLEKWTDEETLRIYKNALNTDVDRTIVTKGAGDVPLLMNTELGKTIGQFKSFAFASHQQVLIAGIQQADVAAFLGISTMIAAGMFSYYLKSKIAERETSNDPNVWIAEGLDRSGLLPIIMEINGIADLMGFGAGQLTGKQPLSRFATRNKISGFLGPSLGQFQDVATVSNAISKGEITEADIKAIRRNLPFQNLFYLRSIFDNLQESIK